MSRTFQDENFLVWEVYPSGAKFGASEDPFLVFHCITDRGLRPRSVQPPARWFGRSNYFPMR